MCHVKNVGKSCTSDSGVLGREVMGGHCYIGCLGDRAHSAQCVHPTTKSFCDLLRRVIGAQFEKRLHPMRCQTSIYLGP